MILQEDMKDKPEAAQQWKNIMTDLMQDWKIISVTELKGGSSAGWVWLVQDASLKPFGKHLGPFAAFKRDEAEIAVPVSSKIRWVFVQLIATDLVTAVICILFHKFTDPSWFR